MMEDLIERLQEGQVILIDKPLEWTSFDVVNYTRNCIRRTLGLKKIKIGHAGTLDPLATGLLILCTGRATKRIDEFQGLPKEYTCTMDFSAATPSFDLETKPGEPTSFSHLDKRVLEESLTGFRGNIRQVPPAFSAIKIDGVRAYEHARRDTQLNLEPREVSIHSFDLVDLSLPEATFHIRCSKGTYIRSLARDLGDKVGCGAHLTALRRTSIGEYNVSDALTPETWCNQLQKAAETS